MRRRDGRRYVAGTLELEQDLFDQRPDRHVAEKLGDRQCDAEAGAKTIAKLRAHERVHPEARQRLVGVDAFRRDAERSRQLPNDVGDEQFRACFRRRILHRPP
jgi:hypothetical protein